MREHGRQIDDPGRLINRGRLHSRNLMLPQSLAHDLEATGKRRVTELPCTAPRRGSIVPISDFSGLVSSICALASAVASAAIEGLDRCITELQVRVHKNEADRSYF